MEPDSLQEKLSSLQKKLADKRRNLLLIQETIAKYVLRETIDLQLLKGEEDTQNEIKEIEDESLKIRNQINDVERDFESKHEREIAGRIKICEIRLEELINSDAPEEELRAVGLEIEELKRSLYIAPSLLPTNILSSRYTLVASIGKGGFSEVWKAYDNHLRRYVAVKVLHPHHAEELAQRRRFFRGAKTMSRLNGSDMPNIVHIIEAEPTIDESNKYCYFVMELIDGYNLGEVILYKKLSLSSDELVKIIGDVGNALQAAYNKDPKIVHRDIKPENIVIRRNNKSACLIDFDLVLMESKSQCTSSGLGSFIYASPEVIDIDITTDITDINSAVKIDRRSDVYSLGMTTVFGLFGQRLPSSEVFTNRLEFISKMNYSPRVLSVLIKSICWQQNERYEDADSFYKALSDAWHNKEKRFLQVPIPSISTQNLALEQPVNPYRISEFTVTNAEYYKFIRTEGYSDVGLRRWWSELGREVWEAYVERRSHSYLFELAKDGSVRNEGDFTDRPMYWDDQKFNHPVQPVVGVSWFEAEAYCNWLLEELRSVEPAQWNDKLIHLPTEAQWHHAACRTDGDLYPWGNEVPNSTLANFNKQRNGGTPDFIDTRRAGASWVGCHDMSGNVWEWCRDPISDRTTGIKDNRPIRGGCCFDDNIKKPISVDARDLRKAGYRHCAIGFRIVVESL